MMAGLSPPKRRARPSNLFDNLTAYPRRTLYKRDYAPFKRPGFRGGPTPTPTELWNNNEFLALVENASTLSKHPDNDGND